MEEKVKIKFKKLNENAEVPKIAYEDSGCFDFKCVGGYYDPENKTIVYRLGISTEFPIDKILNLFPRSSIANLDLILTNCVGQIDANYRGEILTKFKFTESIEFADLILFDFINGIAYVYGQEITIVKKKYLFGLLTLDTLEHTTKKLQLKIYKIGDAVCQGRLSDVISAEFEECEELTETTRGTGGYGSSNK